MGQNFTGKKIDLKQFEKVLKKEPEDKPEVKKDAGNADSRKKKENK